MPSFSGQLSPKQIADVAAYVVQATLGLILPDGFPREVRAIACDLDRTLIWKDAELRPRTRAALAAARRGRDPRAPRHRADVPVGAPVRDPGRDRGSGRLLPGRGRRRAGLGTLAAPRADPARARARGDRGGRRPRATRSTATSDDELYVAEHTAASEAYASFQHLEVHAVGDLLAWLTEPPTKLVAVGDPVELDGLKERLLAHFDGRMYISKSLPYFLEFASPEVTKASGLAFVAEHSGFARERDGRLRRRRERRRDARVGRLRRRGRERARAGAGGRRLRLPARATRRAWRR